MATMTIFLWLILSSCGKAAGRIQVESSVPTPAASAVSTSFLDDTQWHLVEFQSMDDATGIQRTDDPSHYTMRLNGDGTVVMHLNCNHARGTWWAQPGPNSSIGRFEFSILAATGALCPPPSLDEQVSSQAQYIRSYVLKDGRLYLSLMADGGIYVWEKHPEEPF